jgi:hypothetical protein
VGRTWVNDPAGRLVAMIMVVLAVVFVVISGGFLLGLLRGHLNTPCKPKIAGKLDTNYYNYTTKTSDYESCCTYLQRKRGKYIFLATAFSALVAN